MKSKEKFDLVGEIMDFEGGEMDAARTLRLFAYLVETGQAWSLQGSYGRTAARLIEAGYISKAGKILKGVEE